MGARWFMLFYFFSERLVPAPATCAYLIGSLTPPPTVGVVSDGFTFSSVQEETAIDNANRTAAV